MPTSIETSCLLNKQYIQFDFLKYKFPSVNSDRITLKIVQYSIIFYINKQVKKSD